MVKTLEKERDAALFYKEEIAAKYAELELRYKEERAAYHYYTFHSYLLSLTLVRNDVMERETADLHEKLATIQQQTESKYSQQVHDISQKLAEKEREILRLRMQNTTMKKKVEEKERDLEKLKTSRSLSPPPELPIEDLESDAECRQILEKAQELNLQHSKVSVHSYGVKISVDTATAKVVVESPRPITASPRFESKANGSPDLMRRTSTPPLLVKANRSFTPTKSGDSPDAQRHVEIAKTYIYRPQTPTKPGDPKHSSQSTARPQTPTKIEIIKAKATDSTAKAGYEPSRTPDQLQRADSQTRITMQIQAKSPEPMKIILSPKPSARKPKVEPTEEPTPPGKSGPGTPRAFNEQTSQGLEPKQPKLDDHSSPKPGETAQSTYRSGTMRNETSRNAIVFSPGPGRTSSPSPSPSPTLSLSPNPSPRASPSPSPNNVKPPYKLGLNTTSSYTPGVKHTRHSSNPSHATPPSVSPSPRPSSNPSPSQSGSNRQNDSRPSPSPSASPSPVPSSSQKPIAKPEPAKTESLASSFISFLTRSRSSTLPTELPAYSKEREENEQRVTHRPLVSLQSKDNAPGLSSIPSTLSKEDVTHLESYLKVIIIICYYYYITF